MSASKDDHYKWPLVCVESPYAANEEYTVKQNIEYAKRCVLDCIALREIPFASHLLYSQMLDDTKRIERALGIHMGYQWMLCCDKVVVYIDHGISEGMQAAITFAYSNSMFVERRKLLRI